MSRNYGIGSRDMGRAGQMALTEQAKVGAISYSTAATNSERWGEFTTFAKDALGIRQMEQVDQQSVVTYGESLQARVITGELKAATAQNLISAVNSVMALATGGQWKSVSPTQSCGIDARSGIAAESKAISQIEHDTMKANTSERIGVLLDMQRELGLRFEESSKINAKTAWIEAIKTGQITVFAGTKGGLKRTVPASPAAVEALNRAATIQGGDRSMIPGSMNYRDFQSRSYRELARANGHGFHCERHAYAQARYQAITGAPAPVAYGVPRKERFKHLAAILGISESRAKKIDHDARLQVAIELGHGRVEVSNAYLG